MKILVVSGFLGAGKTTFIKALARFSSRDFTVLENEFGSVPVDSNILKKEDIDIVSLTEGCICCSMKGDFRSSILTLKAAVDPEYLIIEPTGVGMLSNIMRLLGEIEVGDITLLKPISIVDPYCYDEFMTKYGEIYKDQIVSSGHIIFSHIEESAEQEIAEFSSKIREINPSCTITDKHYSKMPQDFFLSLLRDSLNKGELKEEKSFATPNLETFALQDAYLKDSQALLYFLQSILYKRYGDIVRAKGLLRVGQEICRFDVADNRYAVKGEESIDEPIEAIFIGKDIKRNELRKSLIPGFDEGKISIKIVSVKKNN